MKVATPVFVSFTVDTQTWVEYPPPPPTHPLPRVMGKAGRGVVSGSEEWPVIGLVYWPVEKERMTSRAGGRGGGAPGDRPANPWPKDPHPPHPHLLHLPLVASIYNSQGSHCVLLTNPSTPTIKTPFPVCRVLYLYSYSSECYSDSDRIASCWFVV